VRPCMQIAHRDLCIAKLENKLRGVQQRAEESVMDIREQLEAVEQSNHAQTESLKRGSKAEVTPFRDPPEQMHLVVLHTGRHATHFPAC
jgi:hypothetical protein